MKNEALTFERALSELGRLQQAMTIGYRLRWQEKTAVFELRCTRGAKIEAQSQAVRNVNPEQAGQILQFLYENAVPMENWKDILQELVFRV